MKEKLIKGLKYLRTNAITTTIVLVVLGGGSVLAANLASGTNEPVANNSTEVTTQAETTLVAQEVTTVAETVKEETTVQETTVAPVQKVVVQEVVTEAPTETPTQAPTFEFYQVNGGYALSKINDNGNLSNVLQVPSSYNGSPVTTINSEVLDGISIEILIIPNSITNVKNSLNCKKLKAIICLNEVPFNHPSFSLTEDQLAGGIKIYVPDNSIIAYKDKWCARYSNQDGSVVGWDGAYVKNFRPLSELDSSISSKIAY